MSDSSAVALLRERARKFQERKDAEEGVRRMEHERLIRCCCAIAALKKASYPMRCGLNPFNAPPSALEIQEHRVTPLLAEVLAALGDADRQQRLEQLHAAETLDHYRQAHDDPQETQLAYAWARHAFISASSGWAPMIKKSGNGFPALRRLLRTRIRSGCSRPYGKAIA